MMTTQQCWQDRRESTRAWYEWRLNEVTLVWFIEVTRNRCAGDGQRNSDGRLVDR